jgi:hypothetical protein
MEDDDCLDILGQQPFLNIYTQLSLVFPLLNPSSHGNIINTLVAGLGRLAKDVPWVAGQVTNRNGIDGGTGSFRVVPLSSTPGLTIRDLRHDESAPTMDGLRRARFPFRMLDEALIAPQKTLQEGIAGAGPDPTPVFAVQATFITGGLVLTFVTQHQTMDMTGQRQVMSLLSRLCRGDKLTESEIADANPTRRGRIPLLDESEFPRPGLGLQAAKAPASKPASDNAPASATWAYFAFSSESLATLKHLAMEDVAAPRFVSTDDTLTAFVWQSVGRVRLQRIASDTMSTLGRAVDVRRYLRVSETSPGMVQHQAFHAHTLQDLAQMPLGAVASELRAAVDPGTSQLAYTTRALATMIDRAGDNSASSLTAGVDPSFADVLISSWANPSFWRMDFGLGLGTPEAVRRPCFVPVEGLCYLMPKSPKGEIAVAVCLRDEDLLQLRCDREFSNYAVYIG